ncbi:hypothetical protein J0H33_01135 [bacterium]|nr:hypothetical protein [bacterium]
MIIAVFGGDEARIRARLQELRDEADGGSGMLESNLTVLDGRDLKPPDVLGPVMSVPFLSAKRLVIVEHLLERYEPRYEARTSRGRSLPATLEPLFEALGQGIPPTTILVFVGLPLYVDSRPAAVSKKNLVVQAVAGIPGATVEEYPAPAGKALIPYIEKAATARGLHLRQGKQGFAPGEPIPRDAGPAALLAALTQGNTLANASAIDKLALFKNGDPDVTMADVYHVCAGERVAGQFDIGDAVLDGDLGRALEALALLHEQGEDTGATLSVLANTYRRLAPVVELVADGAPAEELDRALGNVARYPNLRDRAIRRARKIGVDGLRAAFDALTTADRESKSGVVDRELAVELALARLCSIARH